MMKEIAPVPDISVVKTLQLALFTDSFDGIKAGLRLFPVHKLIILYEKKQTKDVKVETSRATRDFAEQLSNALSIEVEVKEVASSSLEDVLDVLREVFVANNTSFNDILLNLTEGNKMLSCSALSAAFILGIRAYWTDGAKSYMLPVLKLGYHRTISDTKLNILKAVQRSGNVVNSLEELGSVTGYDKAQMSRHVNGALDSKGLVELGLVTTERLVHGRLSIRLTALGRILLMGADGSSP